MCRRACLVGLFLAALSMMPASARVMPPRAANTRLRVRAVGQVTRVYTLPARRNANRITFLTVRTRSGAMQVELGPSSYVTSRHAQYRVGDQVAVVGLRAFRGGRRVLVARTVTKDRRTVVYRNAQGIPLWLTASAPRRGMPRMGAAARRRGGASIPNRRLYATVTGDVVSVQTVPVVGDQVGVVVLSVRTNRGTTIPVELGPPAYLEQQQFSFNPGDHVVAIGMHAYRRDTQELVAREVRSGDRTLRLRDSEGVPLWAPAGGNPPIAPPSNQSGSMGSRANVAWGGSAVPIILAADHPAATSQASTLILARVGHGKSAKPASPQSNGGTKAAQAATAPRVPAPMGGWGPMTEFWLMYDPGRVAAYTGVVQRYDASAPLVGMSPGVVMWTLINDRSMPVYLGPEWYIGPQGPLFQNGDQVTIKGVRTTIGGRPAILAGEVSDGNLTLRLRDDLGIPRWSAVMVPAK